MALADSIFMRGADQELTMVDAYGHTPELLNSLIKNSAKLNIDHYLNYLNNPISNFMDFVDSIKVGASGLLVDTKELAERLGKPLKQGWNSLTTIKDQVKDSVMKAMEKVSGTLSGIGNMISDGVNVYKIIKDVDFKDVGSLLTATSKLTGIDLIGAYVDVQAEAAWLGGLAKEAMRLGIPGAIKALYTKVKDSGFFKSMLADNLLITAKSGDIKTLEAVTSIMEGNYIKSRHPQFIQTTLENFFLPKGVEFEQYGEYRQDANKVFNRIDSGWDKTVHNGVEIPNITPWTKASKDAKKVFSNDKRFSTSILLAERYGRPTDAKRELKVRYPFY